MFELHRFDSLCHAFGFAPVHQHWFAVFDITEGAGTGADVTKHQKCRGAAAPAFSQIGAHGFFTDRVQFLLAHQPVQPLIGLARGRAHLDPIRAAQRSDVTFRDDPVSCRGNWHISPLMSLQGLCPKQSPIYQEHLRELRFPN